VKRKLANSKNTTSDPSCVDERKISSAVSAVLRCENFRVSALLVRGIADTAICAKPLAR
jgi:hypothetical protein